MVKDLISILMPVKNGMPYIKECLESILDQDIDNWELIICNDHSTDDTVKLVNSYVSKDVRIKLLQNKYHGIIPALRACLNFSRGNLITRMDADDIMTNNKLSHLKSQLASKGKGHLAIGKVSYFRYDAALGEGYKKYQAWLNQLIEEGNNWAEIYKECVIPSPAWMTHKDDLIKANAFESDVYPEDYDLAFRFYKSGLQVIPTDQTIHYWRDHSKRSSRTDDNYSDNRFLDLKCKYFLELDYNPIKTTFVWGAGKKGKTIAKYFSNQNIDFTWISNNTSKHGKHIYDILVEPVPTPKTLENSQVICAIAARGFEQKLEKMIEGMYQNCAFYKFC